MTAEQIIEAAMRGLVRALLDTQDVAKTRSRRSSPRRVARKTVTGPASFPGAAAGATTAAPTLFEMPPRILEDDGGVTPPSAAELDSLLAQFKNEDVSRALNGDDAPGTYRPDEGVMPWMGSS